MQFERWFPIDLNKGQTHAYDIGTLLCSGDENSVRVGVSVSRNKTAEDVTGTIKGYVTLPNGLGLMPFDGAKAGNAAWIDLPEDALGMTGRINIAIRSFDENETTVLLLASATVRRVDADQYYDPTDIVGDITDLIEDAEQAAADAAAALSAAENVAETMTSDATGVDVDVTDENGNVILRMANGHLQTKNFDSSQKRFSGKKWAAIGDSLTEVNSKTTLHYHDYIAAETGITVVNLGKSGRGYAKESGGATFAGVVSSIPSDTDVITIFGSGNDMAAGLDLGEITDTGTTTLCGCINTALSAIYAEFMTTPLGIITPTPWKGNEPSNTMGNPMFQPYCEALVQIAARRGIPCLDLYHCSLLHPSDADFRDAAYSKDVTGGVNEGVHPDETGHALIAPRIREFIASLL